MHKRKLIRSLNCDANTRIKATWCHCIKKVEKYLFSLVAGEHKTLYYFSSSSLAQAEVNKRIKATWFSYIKQVLLSLSGVCWHLDYILSILIKIRKRFDTWSKFKNWRGLKVNKKLERVYASLQNAPSIQKYCSMVNTYRLKVFFWGF